MRAIAAAWLVAALSSSACVPIYRTDYDFTPPADRIGRLCAAECDVGRRACRVDARSHAQAQLKQCQAQAQQDYQNCLTATDDPQQRRYCYLRECDAHADYSSCDTTYRSCFGGCGGAVIKVRKCVLNCRS